MRFTRCSRVLPILCVLSCASCGSIIPSTIPKGAAPQESKRMDAEKSFQETEASSREIESRDESYHRDESVASSESTSACAEEAASAEEDDGLTLREEGDGALSRGAPEMTNQELLDSALEYCQASNDFWERGDLENALDALDKAYSLILKIKTDNDAEVLQQKEDLRFTISKRIIETYASRFTAANGSHKAIPLVMNRHVERALDIYKGRERAFFLESYRRSGRYRPSIVKALHEAGLPEELSWLPLIESGFKVRAMSRARALGLWQFIASTGYKFGLKRDHWIDERMDPEKSTQAAIGYLKELHQIFGDWTTVLAAYNCGERRVLNRIKSQRINYLDNFWDLYEMLPRETAFYVPRFLAVLHILSDPEAHGFILPPVDPAIETEAVTINKQVHLKTIAKRLDIDYGLLKDINAELRHDCTPKDPHALKVPAGKGGMLLAKLDDIPVWQPPVPAYVVHRVRPGESLSVIAARYKTSVRSIMAMNSLRRSHYLRVGWKLRIPTSKLRASQLNRLERPPVQTASLKDDLVTYVVEEGDSLWIVAERFGTTIRVIQSLNHLSSSELRVGQVLKVPRASSTSDSTETDVYRVRKGDSPYLIARRHRMNLAEFLELNHLTPRSTIFPGQTLLVKAD
ncbi:MAG: LysM peptidoglycan-binding domain-containing protein [Deltaproteobacteria bacterium]|jgi:membrane-bound lytic murein transglycosylase D